MNDGKREIPSIRLPWYKFTVLGPDPLGFLTRLEREYGAVVELRLFGLRLLVINDPQLIGEVLLAPVGSFHKDRGLRLAKRLLGDGLLTSEGESHLRQRRMMQPAFHRERLAEYATSMVKAAEELGDRWRDGQQVDMAREMMRLTLTIVARTLFGSDVERELEGIGQALDTAMNQFDVGRIPILLITSKLPVRSTREFRKARRYLDSVVYRMIEERRRELREGRPQRHDLLSILLQQRDQDNGRGMTDEQLRDEAMTIFLAGHETTADALAWTWYLLAQHPEVEQRLRAELNATIGHRTAGLSDLQHLCYTEQIFTEAMRLYPPAWAMGRIAQRDVHLSGVTVRKGTAVLMSQWVMHRLSRYFPEPEKFLPERWTSEFRAVLPRYAYFPFGGGNRMCIGERFAWMEGMLALASLKRRWRAELVEPNSVAPIPRITLRPDGGIMMRLVKLGHAESGVAAD